MVWNDKRSPAGFWSVVNVINGGRLLKPYGLVGFDQWM